MLTIVYGDCLCNAIGAPHFFDCAFCATADGQGVQAVLAACAARRWLARNAADVTVFHSFPDVKAPACESLVFCLPALEVVTLVLCEPTRDDLGSLLEALAWCPRLRALDLSVEYFEDSEGDDDQSWPSAYESAFAKLSCLTKLKLVFEDELCTVADVLGALVPLTGLVELDLLLRQPAVVPAALGHFRHLQSLALRGFSPCALETGCLDLPNLRSLQFVACTFEEDAQVLPGISALQNLTRIEILGGVGLRFFDPHFVYLALQRLVLYHNVPDDHDDDDEVGNSAPVRLLWLPDDMGLLSSSLLHLDVCDLSLAQFPLAVTQLVALECLHASENEFTELPAGITALSRLTELKLGRAQSSDNPLQIYEKRPLNAVALGDLSAFPALCKLIFSFCEMKLCKSLLGGAERHANLACIFLHFAHPAPESVPMILQLSQELNGMLNLTGGNGFDTWGDGPAQALPPFYKFKTALELCAL